jgi:hypothetical protein
MLGRKNSSHEHETDEEGKKEPLEVEEEKAEERETKAKTILRGKSANASTEGQHHHVDLKQFMRDTAAINNSIEPYCVM